MHGQAMHFIAPVHYKTSNILMVSQYPVCLHAHETRLNLVKALTLTYVQLTHLFLFPGELNSVSSEIPVAPRIQLVHQIHKQETVRCLHIIDL